MSKYTDKINLEENSIDGFILGSIDRNSSVLELGCGGGRMTRYMKEELGCRTYIVEKCREDFYKAIDYAEDGMCADIMEDGWKKRLEGMQFDNIILADVLEHLTDPESVMEAASALLSDSGTIMVSVPNVAHNDILIKLYHNRLDYTPTGLLDDTHVHFWGPANLIPWFERWGLVIDEIHTTVIPVGGTEQFSDHELHMSLFESNLLRERRFGTAYQFVLKLKKGTTPGSGSTRKLEMAMPVPGFEVRVYISREGRGFTPQDYISGCASLIENGCYRLHVELPFVSDVEAISIDPLDGQETIWKDIRIHQGGKQIIPPKAMFLGGEQIVFATSDEPQTYVPLENRFDPLVIDITGVICSEEFYKLLREMIREKDGENLKQ